MLIEHGERFGLREGVTRQGRVLHAVMLRNIRTRFFGHGLGYLVALAWPLTHIVILLALWSFASRAPPFGESVVLFLATGTVPFMVFSYLSRFMQLSVIMTRPLLAFPEVKVLDVLFASAVLEILSSCCVVLILLVLAWFFDIPVMPRDIVEAFYAFGAAVLLGFGVGLLMGVIALAAPVWMTIYGLLTIVLWMTSGVIFVPDFLPEPMRTMASYHPVLQLVEWMRSAYYEGYGEGLLDRRYVLGVAIGSIFLGLVIERATRGHVLALR
ncbi:ABC transporter permease [Methylocystis bryophila]|uniref:ABC transporter n=1 Tax=Methylocystis bryophila TaxID=655015 RepID=A0A1W6MU11_9HYPH|nr:ABC transporter permease [Methylocystis bryophila]ARN81088.1 ABC transporter [Methylocystis bryophila]BDV37016.1 transport permease protein [Methylocystis bryophila]